MSVLASIVRTTDLQPGRRAEMFALMERCFDGVNPATFSREMSEKDWTILLQAQESGQLCGFSTLAIMTAVVDNVRIQAFFSGDTVVLPDYWGSLELERAWLHFVFSQVSAAPDSRWYWFLICKGYRTYRYLPVYFRHYYPAPDTPMPPFERNVLHTLAHHRFGRQFDAQTGVIRCPGDYRLRASIDNASVRAAHDRRVAFFCRQNPEWTQGAELACLTELSMANLRAPALRALRRDSGA